MAPFEHPNFIIDCYIDRVLFSKAKVQKYFKENVKGLYRVKVPGKTHQMIVKEAYDMIAECKEKWSHYQKTDGASRFDKPPVKHRTRRFRNSSSNLWKELLVRNVNRRMEKEGLFYYEDEEGSIDRHRLVPLETAQHLKKITYKIAESPKTHHYPTDINQYHFDPFNPSSVKMAPFEHPNFMIDCYIDRVLFSKAKVQKYMKENVEGLYRVEVPGKTHQMILNEAYDMIAECREKWSNYQKTDGASRFDKPPVKRRTPRFRKCSSNLWKELLVRNVNRRMEEEGLFYYEDEEGDD